MSFDRPEFLTKEDKDRTHENAHIVLDAKHILVIFIVFVGLAGLAFALGGGNGRV